MDPPILNPGNCKDLVFYQTRRSALLSMLGGSPDWSLRFIRRNISPTDTSPWSVQNLNRRFQRASQAISEQEARELRQSKFNPSLSRVVILENFNFGIQNYIGSLANILSSRYSRQLGPLEAWKAKMVTIRVLDGLAYLHCKHRVVHGDICSYTVLVDEDFYNIKLCGFGTTPEGKVSCKYVAIGLWTAPEILDKTVKKAFASDIFSFGMVVYEMLTAMPPHTFPGIRTVAIAEPATVISTRNLYRAKKIGISSTWKPRPRARMSTAPLPQHLLPENRCPNSCKNHLNYACLGTRPAIQHAEALNDDYNELLALFYICTEPNYKLRPSSFRLQAVWKKAL